MKPRANLTEVARVAGVSVSAASRALTGDTASPQTRARVQAAARDLGYVPNSTARSLKRGSSRVIAFAVDDLSNPNYTTMLDAVERVVRPAGGRLSVTSTGSSPTDTIGLLDQLNAGGADGIIISPLRISPQLVDDIENSVVPVVVVGSLGGSTAVDRVTVDSGKAVELVVDHVVDQGRRRLLFLNGPLDTNPGKARLRGFLTATDRNSQKIEDARSVSGQGFTIHAGQTMVRELLAAKQPLPDALIAANDLIALGAISELRQAGLDVPTDVAVTGIDDTETAAIYHPTLTSVSLQTAQRGTIAATMLMDRFEHPARPVRHETVDPRLIIRGSSTT